MGIGGANLKSVESKCTFLMKVSEKVSFQDYWVNDRYSLRNLCATGFEYRC